MTAPAPSEPAAREALVATMRRMHASGLNRGTSGNASVRVPGGMLITPSGVTPDVLTPGSMVLVAPAGTYAEDGLRPSTEFRMHQRILESRPEAQAVVHCHSRYATILACCNQPIEPLHYMVLVARASCVKIAPFAAFGTAELADAVVETMGSAYACLLANHGQVTIGGTLSEACAIAEEIEEQAAIAYGALMLGGGRLLTQDQLAATVAQFGSYGQR